MTKLLLFIAILAVIYLLVRASKRPRPPPPDAKSAEEAMAQCAHCGLHFPLNEAVDDSGRVFCSEAHRRLGVKK